MAIQVKFSWLPCFSAISFQLPRFSYNVEHHNRVATNVVHLRAQCMGSINFDDRGERVMRGQLVATGAAILLLSQFGLAAESTEVAQPLPAKVQPAAVEAAATNTATTVSQEQMGAIEVNDSEPSQVTKSEATRLREEREQLEIRTEEEMTQELERARIEGEKARREQFFAKDVFNSNPQPVEPEPVPVEEAPVAPVVQGQVQAEYMDSDVESESYRFYLGLYGGMLNYPTVSNVAATNGAAGVALGLSLTDQFWLEAGMTYSFQQSETQNFNGVSTDDIDHIGLSAVASYKFNFAAIPWLIPSLGVVGAYTNRQYNGGATASNSFDAGVAVGSDISVGGGVTLGVEYRYLTNLSYQRDTADASFNSSLQGFSTTATNDLESFDYQLLMVNAKILF